jgi:transcriptional regulator with XRE-family HTH domain
MKKYLSSHLVLNEIGSRLKTYRINSSLTQDELALKAGISRRSIQNVERGEDVKFGTIIKVLMALQLDSNLDILVPDTTKRPSYYLNMKSETHYPHRVRKKKENEQKNTFKWGDEM